jgi:hypothetical protein
MDASRTHSAAARSPARASSAIHEISSSRSSEMSPAAGYDRGISVGGCRCENSTWRVGTWMALSNSEFTLKYGLDRAGRSGDRRHSRFGS